MLPNGTPKGKHVYIKNKQAQYGTPPIIRAQEEENLLSTTEKVLSSR